MRYIPYSRQDISMADIRAVTEVMKSSYITQGPKVKEFEEAICAYTGSRYAVCVSSGTAALHIACLAAGVKANNEVITSPITFLASANCALYCGAKPVFVDIELDTANIDPIGVDLYLKKKSQPRVKAIIPVHFAGHPCEIEKIWTLAKSHNIIVIEDSCHALGAEYLTGDRIQAKRQWVKVGSCRHSDMSILSFHPVKSITTGEGGAVLTNRRDLYDKLVMLRQHGVIKGKKNWPQWFYEMRDLGFNYRITDIQSALGISQLKRLDAFIKRRSEIASLYEKELCGIEEIECPKERPGNRSAWHLFTLRLRDYRKRKSVFEQLRKFGIGVQVHYIPVYWQPYYRNNTNYKAGHCPMAENFYLREISIPLYPSMKNKDVAYVVSALKKILKNNGHG